MEKKKNKKFIFKIILCLILLFLAIYIPYALKNPVTSKINYVFIRQFSDTEKNDRESVKDRINGLQKFYKPDEVLSDDTNDYALVVYSCNVKSNCFSSVGGIYCIVDNVPENNKFFVSAERGLGPAQTAMFFSTENRVAVLVNRHGLTDEEIIEKIKTIELKVTYKHKGEAGEVKVKGIDSLKSDDIEWLED